MIISGKEASKLFSSKALKSLANGDYSLINKVSKHYLLSDTDYKLDQVFDLALAKLGTEYRSEYYYKNSIAQKLLIRRHSLNTATMLTEFRVGRSKADCVIFNGKSTCYEIKSDIDTLTRLPEQLSDYLKIFDEVYVVCSAKHFDDVMQIAPVAVGVLILTQKNYLRTKRKATFRNNKIDTNTLCKSLRKEEYTELATRIIGQTLPKLPNSLLFDYCLNIISKNNSELTSKYFVDIIKSNRANNKSLIEALPDSLASAVISYRITKSEEESLITAFN